MLQCPKIAANLKKDLTDSFWASEGSDPIAMVKTHPSHAFRKMTQVIKIIVTGPFAEFARVKASGMRAAFIKLAK